MILCVDEKTSLQPRPRKLPTLAAQPRRPVWVEHEYGRQGALNLFAAFETRSCKIYGRTVERKRQVELIAFLEPVDRALPATIKTIQGVLDNLKRHTGKQVQAWLAPHPGLCSISRRCIARGGIRSSSGSASCNANACGFLSSRTRQRWRSACRRISENGIKWPIRSTEAPSRERRSWPSAS
jgi:DDE superfamily endonuclease